MGQPAAPVDASKRTQGKGAGVTAAPGRSACHANRPGSSGAGGVGVCFGLQPITPPRSDDEEARDEHMIESGAFRTRPYLHSPSLPPPLPACLRTAITYAGSSTEWKKLEDILMSDIDTLFTMQASRAGPCAALNPATLFTPRSNATVRVATRHATYTVADAWSMQRTLLRTHGVCNVHDMHNTPLPAACTSASNISMFGTGNRILRASCDMQRGRGRGHY